MTGTSFRRRPKNCPRSTSTASDRRQPRGVEAPGTADDHEPRNPAHPRAILALSTAFWDVMLLGDPAARAWLDGDGPQHLLDQDDRWQTK